MTTVTEVSAVSSASTGAEPSARARLRRRRLVIRASQLALVVVFVGGWELAVRARLIDEFTYGRPSGVVNQLKTWFLDGTEADIFDPFIKMMNSIPRIVLGSIFILWFGLGLLSKVILVIVLVFFAVFFNAFQGAREVDRNLIANARILGASPRKVTWQVVVPSAMTWIIASLHIAFGFALIGAIVGEFIGSQQGLGLLINEARGAFNPNGVYAAMLIIAVIALAAEWLITRLERRLLRWRPSQLPSSPDI